MIEFDPVMVHDWLTRSARRHPDKTNLETFMMPKYIGFVDNLPTTAHGKINKKILKAAEIE